MENTTETTNISCYICANNNPEIDKVQISYLRDGREDPTTVCSHHPGVKSGVKSNG